MGTGKVQVSSLLVLGARFGADLAALLRSSSPCHFRLSILAWTLHQQTRPRPRRGGYSGHEEESDPRMGAQGAVGQAGAVDSSRWSV